MSNRLTHWFPIQSGVRQWDSLLPTLFAIFINDLAKELHASRRCIIVNDIHISPVMYGEDIVVLAETLDDAQAQMDILSD